MKHVTFKKLSISNFLSVGKEPVEIEFKSGLHVITGINKDKEDRRNGVGKSTIADAIHFAIFGDTLRDLKKEFIINNKTGRDCQVELILQLRDKSTIDEVRIIRKLGPTKCFLYINGEDKTRDSIPNTTSVIHDMLAASPEIFQNCVIMTINNTTPFMAKKKVEKRKFIEGIFNLEVFGDMLKEIRLDLNSTKQTYEVEQARFDEMEKSLVTLIEQLKAGKIEKKKREEKLKDRKSGNIKDIEQETEKLKREVKINIAQVKKKLKDSEDHIDKCDEKLATLNRAVAEKETGIKFKSREKASIGTDKDVCPTCLAKITNKSRKRMEERSVVIDDRIGQLGIEIEDTTTKISEYVNLKDVLKQSISTYNNQVVEKKDYDNLKDHIKQLEKWNAEIDSDLSNHVDEFEQLNKGISNSEKTMKEVKRDLSATSEKLQMLETVKFIVSEEGVKSYIVKKILNLFNNKLAYYLNKMDANCQCTFNEYFEEEIINEKGKLCSYFNFSGAERKNIDLACLFAFMDIRRMQGDVAYNVSVYDELFDSSLDEKGVELVLDILKARVEKYNECIMVISHRKESIKAATGDVIFLEKSQGITRKVEYVEYNVN